MKEDFVELRRLQAVEKDLSLECLKFRTLLDDRSKQLEQISNDYEKYRYQQAGKII